MSFLNKIFKKKDKKNIESEWEIEYQKKLDRMTETYGTEAYEEAFHDLAVYMVEEALLNYEKAAFFLDRYNQHIHNYLVEAEDNKRLLEKYTNMEKFVETCGRFDRGLVRHNRMAIVEGLRKAWEAVEVIKMYNEVPGGIKVDYKEIIKEYRENPRRDIHAEEVAKDGKEYPPLTDELIARFNFVVDFLSEIARADDSKLAGVDKNFFLVDYEGKRLEIDYIGSGLPLEETVDAPFPLA